MPHRETIENGEGQRRLTEVEEHGVCQTLFTECGQNNGEGKINRINGARGQDKPALRLTRNREEPGQMPGAADHRERNKAGSQRELPGCRGQGDRIKRDQNRCR